MGASVAETKSDKSSRDKPWIIRTYAGHSTAAESNKLYRGNLAKGQTGLSVAFDLPTQTGYDPDHELSRGEVGKVGVSIAHLGDMRTLFQDIPLAQMNTSMTINATAPWLLALYLAVAEEQGAPLAALQGTTQNDIIKEYLSRGTYVFPPAPSLRLTKDVILFTTKNVPKWNPMNVCSYHLQEAGATPVQELSYALAIAIAVLDTVRDDPEFDAASFSDVFGRISFFVNAGLRFVTEICKMRAFSELWDEIAQERYGIDDPKKRIFRYGVQVNSLGLTEQQVAQNMNISLSGSYQVTPNFWPDPKTGIPYQLWVQTPEYRNSSLTDLRNTPIFVRAAATSGSGPGVLTLLSSLADIRRTPTQTMISHVNIQPTFDIFASVQDRALGTVARAIDAIVQDEQKNLEAPDKIVVRGQIENMRSAFFRLEIGLGIALIAVYLLMAVNYQSWGDPFVVIAALPMAFCGITFALFVTGTTFSIPSIFGAIMSVGVASANSILLVTFAREQQLAGKPAAEAAVDAGHTRIRPVLMTAAAMIVGMIPMAIGGPGEEQNAALARAVIGGLLFATPTTLLIVPYLFSVLRKGNDGKPAHGVFEQEV